MENKNLKVKNPETLGSRLRLRLNFAKFCKNTLARFHKNKKTTTKIKQTACLEMVIS